MDIFKDLLQINKQTLKKTVSSLKNNYMIIFTGIAYILLNTFVSMAVFTLFRGVLGLIGGIVIALFSASLISNYLYLLYNIINYDRLNFQDFKDGFTFFMRKVYVVFFFGYIGNMILSIFYGALGSNAYLLNMIVSISILVLLNPLPESIYLKDKDPMGSIMYAVDFMKDNWLNWLIPNVLFHGVLFYLTGNIITNLFSTHVNIGFGIEIGSIIKYLIAQVLFSFIMIYRGHLFKLLSTSTRRKRMYMNKF